MKYLITIEYMGTNYSGWQNQKNAISIQQILEEELSNLLKERIIIYGSGRTDKGVHALNQKAHFETENTLEMQKIVLAINTKLPKDIRIKKIEKAQDNFHAQYSAVSRRYLYKFYVSRIISPTREDRFAQIIPPINFELMQKGSKLLIGTHDFKAFSSVGHRLKSTIRTIKDISLYKKEDEIFLEIEGNGFLYKMVRTIAGTLVYLAKGKLTLEDIQEALKSGDRKKTGKTYPAHALYLKEVFY